MKLTYRIYHYRNGNNRDVFHVARKVCGFWVKYRMYEGVLWCDLDEIAREFLSRESAIAFASYKADQVRAELDEKRRDKLTLVMVEDVEL